MSGAWGLSFNTPVHVSWGPAWKHIQVDSVYILKKGKKEEWSVMIIECTDKRAVSIRWGNEIDKLMEKI